MKIFGDRQRPAYADVIGKTAVGAQHPATPAAFASRIEMNDLARRVHAGIRAARTNDVNGFIGNQRKRFLEALLNANTGLLALPASVRSPVILDAERDANVGAC